MDPDEAREEDSLGDLAFLVGARETGEVGWIDLALGPAYFWDTQWQGQSEHTYRSGVGLETVASFGFVTRHKGLGLSIGYLLAGGTHRLAICFVAEIPPFE